jgi:hypothetical protein
MAIDCKFRSPIFGVMVFDPLHRFWQADRRFKRMYHTRRNLRHIGERERALVESPSQAKSDRDRAKTYEIFALQHSRVLHLLLRNFI